jgi:hypothetical protein
LFPSDREHPLSAGDPELLSSEFSFQAWTPFTSIIFHERLCGVWFSWWSQKSRAPVPA